MILIIRWANSDNLIISSSYHCHLPTLQDRDRTTRGRSHYKIGDRTVILDRTGFGLGIGVSKLELKLKRVRPAACIHFFMARDKYHELVKAALVKEGWLITDDPLIVEAGKRKIQVDLGAERLIAAEKEGEKIAVEVKSFIGASTLHDFYEALGQFNFYQYALEKKMPERSLFLAVPDDTFEEFFKEDFIAELLVRYQVKMLVYRIDEACIEQWIK